MQKIILGDNVMMILGKDSGKVAKVSKVLPKEKKLFVEGVNIYKRNLRANVLKSHNGQDSAKGQIIDIQKPVDLSNVMLVCPNCKKPTRVGFKLSTGALRTKEKLRICRKCGKEISNE